MYEQKDYLMKQIEEFGQVLGNILSSILSLKNAGNNTNTYATIQKSFSEESDIDLEHMILLSEEDFIKFISDTFFDNHRILEILANTFSFSQHTKINSIKTLINKK